MLLVQACHQATSAVWPLYALVIKAVHAGTNTASAIAAGPGTQTASVSAGSSPEAAEEAAALLAADGTNGRRLHAFTGASSSATPSGACPAAWPAHSLRDVMPRAPCCWLT